MKTQPLDMSYLRKFCDQDESFVQEMIQTLLEKIPEELDLLEQSLSNEKWDSTYKAIHGLKSSLHLAGLPHLKNELQQLENDASAQKNLAQLKIKSKQLLEVGRDVVKQLQVLKAK